MQANTCANCNNSFEQATPFCAQCGQRTATHRFTIPHLVHEVVHAATHADKGLFLLIRELSLRPGQVLNDYIVVQRRKRYFNPFTFLVLMAGLLLFSTALFKPYNANDMYTAEQKASMEAMVGKDKATAVMQRTQQMNRFMEKNAKMILLASVPLTALVFWLLFSGRGLNFAEHLVASVFLTAFLALVMALLFTPVMGVFKSPVVYGFITAATLLFQWLYFGWAYHVLLRQKQPVAAWKPYGVSLLNIIIWSIITTAAGMVYVYAGVFI
ncbi:MAG TPA: DUF3667 domain-containing protein [Lacibacter sp.]|nr:DUF3667 domain-containing protein [Lacibacter sp.]HMO87973.1 DUF3667 domain-containing protein [Lacibacter sp.]